MTNVVAHPQARRGVIVIGGPGAWVVVVCDAAGNVDDTFAFEAAAFSCLAPAQDYADALGIRLGLPVHIRPAGDRPQGDGGAAA